MHFIIGELFDGRYTTDYLLGNAPIENKTDNSNNNGVIVGNNNAHIRIDNHERILTKQEQDLLRIYNNATTRQQIKLMDCALSIEEERNDKK